MAHLLVACLLVVVVGWVTLAAQAVGAPATAARSGGYDAEWLGHAWVDGRKTDRDVRSLAGQLRGTGIHDLFVHAGPFHDDGTLDPARRPRARWLVAALHEALPGVRVQAWLGDLVGPGHLDLDSAATRARVLAADRLVLADGFDGIHYDFEPVRDGEPGLLRMLEATRTLTHSRHVLLSVSAIHLEPLAGLRQPLSLLPGHPCLWSAHYLHEVALRVDQVAVMAYDTGLYTQPAYAGYVHRQTLVALAAVPARVQLFIGTPAYHDENHTHHRRAETVAASLRGVRLAVTDRPPRHRLFGVAVYVDFAATDRDWSSYRAAWAPRGT